jgi:hypothetical protein
VACGGLVPGRSRSRLELLGGNSYREGDEECNYFKKERKLMSEYSGVYLVELL